MTQKKIGTMLKVILILMLGIVCGLGAGIWYGSNLKIRKIIILKQ